MPTLAIEIELNGRRIAVAGSNDLSLLNAHVGAGVGPERRCLSAERDTFQLTAMGVTVPTGDRQQIQNLTWINDLPLKLGDSVTFRLVATETPDLPAEGPPIPTSAELSAAR